MSAPFPPGVSYADGLPALATPRLALRALTEADDAAILAMLSDPGTAAGWGVAPFTGLSQAADYRRRQEAVFDARSGATWGAFEAGRLVGLVLFVRWTLLHRRAELGYLLAPDARGRGLATEAARAAVAFAFDAMDVWRVEAETTPHNLASQAVMRRLGFMFEARLAQRIGGIAGPEDSMLFRLLRPEFDVVRVEFP